MKKRKLKAYVLPVLYVLVLGVIIGVVALTSKNLNTAKDNLDYSVSSINEDESVPVVKEETPTVVKPLAPYVGETITISKDYYSKDDDTETQQNSLILYENTYLENTGILYTAQDPFDVVASVDGTVKSVKDDNILGKVIEIAYNNNLTTYYYSLNDVKVNVGDKVTSGDILGKSGDNKIENKEGTSLLFEVYYQGKSMDPKAFYETDLSTLK